MAKTSLRFERRFFEQKVQDFVQKLWFEPKNFIHFYLAFVHRSVLNEASADYYQESNERLEFLGDAVLELVITEQLFLDFPLKTEWEMTDIRSAVVRGRNLAAVATKLWMSDTIQLSRGEIRVNGHENPYILANTLEAFIGALYLSFGMSIAKNFILTHIYASLDDIIHRGLYVDPKSFLQEISQSYWGILPEYQILTESGQDHNKIYEIGVFFGEVLVWKWKWSSKKKGEQDAAENAISLRDEWENSLPFIRKNQKNPA